MEKSAPSREKSGDVLYRRVGESNRIKEKGTSDVGAREAMKDTVGIVLAGGMSRRFGGEKSLASRDGKAFVQYSLEALKHLDETVLVTREDLMTDMPRLDKVRVIPDLQAYRGMGPLAGIFSAMARVKSRWYTVLPCDTPWIHRGVVCRLLALRDEKWDVICSRVNRELQPLIAIYHGRTKNKIRLYLDQRKLSVRGFLLDCAVKEVDFDEKRWFYNVNTREDWIRFSRKMG